MMRLFLENDHRAVCVFETSQSFNAVSIARVPMQCLF